jgi:hypothetical protein
VPAGAPDGARWLAWTDTNERAHLTPLAPALVPTARDMIEPSLENARVLAAAPPDGLYALVDAAPEASGTPAVPPKPAGPAGSRPELRRFACR